jgi:hypothetical protein
MTEHPLLEAIVKRAREERAREDALLKDAGELLAPFDGAARDRFAKAIFAEVAAPAAAPIDLAARRRKRMAAIVSAASIAAAAVIALFVALRPVAVDPLPVYSLNVSSGATKYRGAAPELKVFRPDSKMILVLRPDEAVSGPIAFRAFIERGGTMKDWAPPSAISADGSIKIEGQAGELLGAEPGVSRLIIFVGHADQIEHASMEREEDPRFRVVEQKILVESAD